MKTSISFDESTLLALKNRSTNISGLINKLVSDYLREEKSPEEQIKLERDTLLAEVADRQFKIELLKCKLDNFEKERQKRTEESKTCPICNASVGEKNTLCISGPHQGRRLCGSTAHGCLASVFESNKAWVMPAHTTKA